MFKKIARSLWGEFESYQELKKFGMLASILFCIIGAFWAMKPTKDSIFAVLVGIDYLPLAKIVSSLFTIPLLMIYTKLVDLFKREQLFYLIIGFYALLSFVFYYFLSHPYYGIENDSASFGRLLGWIWYLYVDSFVSLALLMFWSIVVDTTKPDSAKRGFPIILLFGQMGTIAGPFFLRASRFGFVTSAPIIIMVGCVIALIGVLMRVFMKTTPKYLLQGYEEEKTEEEVINKEKKKTGFLEGIRLIFKNWYLLGIVAIIGIYEATVAIIDFHFHIMVKMAYPQEAANAEYLAQFGVWIGIVVVASILFGVSSIQRWFGMKISLLVMPILVAIGIVILKINPILSVVTLVMVFIKATSYALNVPSMKQLYIPTTKAVRYKAQGWIDMFGLRSAKSLGGIFNLSRVLLKYQYGALAGIQVFLTIGVIFSLSMISCWILIVLFVAKIYDRAIKKGEVVC